MMRCFLPILLLFAVSSHGAAQFPEGFFSEDRIQEGNELADVVCASCHLRPDPGMLIKEDWMQGALPWMMGAMGLAPVRVPNPADLELIRKSGRILDPPPISHEDFGKIIAYYLSGAPEQYPEGGIPNVKRGVPGFSMHPADYRSVEPTTMMVQHDGSKGLWIADAKWNSLVNLDATGKALGTIPIRNPVVQVRHGEKGMDVLSIGRFFPTEQRLGSLLRLERQGEHFRNPEILIDGLHRPVHASWGDLNEDGREDVVISQFGWYGGRFSWFEKKGEDGYEEHLLFDKPGSLKSVILDWNDDGHPDILSLVAQETEAMLLFVNNGKGEFSETRLFQRHSGFGHTHFELLDWDRDGDQDLLVTNGDLGDYASAHRPYHGIRIYRNDGSAGFEEAWFHPMPGAYKALARDFDQDGDLDIAAISYFPDFSKGNDGGFLFLQNQGGNTYEASTFGRASDGRWLTMDVGDIDRDGDEDIVLGAANKAPGNVPKAQVDHWKKTRTSVMILKNGLR